MSIKNICCYLAFMLVSHYTSFAQQNNPTDLPVVIPASPEVSALINTGLMSNDLYTGAAAAAIKLFEIQNGALNFPINLSYRSNGIKVNDIASRVGIGWSLTNSGVISRSVRDVDDLKFERNWQTPPDFTPYEGNQYLYNYLWLAGGQNYDSELDIYSFSVNGYSGEFYIDLDGTPRQIHYSNLYISKESNTSFLIRTPDGVKYFFGGPSAIIEKTKSYNSNGSGVHEAPVTTAWFLYRILSPEGDEILFSYSDIEPRTMNGFHQSVILKKIGGGSSSVCLGCDENYCKERFPLPTQNRTDYYSKYLTQITASNGIKVSFNYESRGDLSNDNRLKEMIVSYNGSQGYQTHKKFVFNYGVFNASTTLNKRFFLNNLQEMGTDNSFLQYDFQYEDPGGLPDQYSLNQDYYGYANGAFNITHFFPKPPTYSLYVNASLGADRNPNEIYAKKGSLKKITYPTGGYQEFVYEGHTVPEWVTETVYTSVASLYKAGQSNVTPVEDVKTATTNDNGKFKIDFSVFLNPNGPQPGQPGYFQADGQHPLAKVEIRQTGTTSPVINPVSLTNYGEQSTYIVEGLLPNTSYTIKLIVYKHSASASAIVSVPVVTSYWANKPACGVRVKQIKSLTHTGAIPVNKYYTYALPDNLEKSSGVGLWMSDYQQSYLGGGLCNYSQNGCCSNPYCMIVEQVQCQTLTQFSSSSLSSMSSFNGSSVGYTDILESEDEQMGKGTVQNTFAAYFANISQVKVGTIMPAVPVVEEPSVPNGTLLSQKFFKKVSGSFSLLKEITNTYAVDNREYHSFNNHIIRQRWSGYPYPTGNFTLADILIPFDAVMYRYQSFWYHLNKKTETTYFENEATPLTEETNYEYSNSQHALTTRIVNTNSKGETIEQLLTYPADYPGVTPYPSMVTKGIIGPVIQMTKNKVVAGITTPLEKVKTGYGIFGTNEKPNEVLVGLGNATPVQRISFNQYNSSGDILERQKTNDVKEVYLWGYKSNYPVAKILNSSSGSVSALITQSVLDNPVDDQTLRSHLDILRSIPGALVTTYTYKPLVGITSETDARGRTTYYSYDNFNRLTLIRDHDNNILRRICYNYAGQPEDCVPNSNTNPLWQSTGETRCQPCPANSNYTSGILEHKETDNNPASITYGDYRWVSDGANSGCTPQPDWQNTAAALRCQLGANGYTGYQEQQQKDMNPCSPSYNQTQWIVAGYNPTACSTPPMVQITFSNIPRVTGFTAVYTNTVTAQTYSFPVPTRTGTLGSIPAGTYTIYISKPSSNWFYMFGCGCLSAGGTSATFNNVNVTASACNSITIEVGF